MAAYFFSDCLGLWHSEYLNWSEGQIAVASFALTFILVVMGGFMFGMVFMATDPVTATSTTKGKLIYGFFGGFFSIMIRVFNPAYPEGVMMAILFMNIMAPMIDHYVIQANINRRQKRLQTI